MTTAPTTSPQPTIDETLERMRKAFTTLKGQLAEEKNKRVASDQRITDLESQMSVVQQDVRMWGNEFRRLKTILNRPVEDLLACPRRCDRLDGYATELMADLHKREAEA